MVVLYLSSKANCLNTVEYSGGSKMKILIRDIEEVVTQKHREVCKCVVCLGSFPELAIIIGTHIGYSCAPHVQPAIEKMKKMVGQPEGNYELVNSI